MNYQHIIESIYITAAATGASYNWNLSVKH